MKATVYHSWKDLWFSRSTYGSVPRCGARITRVVVWVFLVSLVGCASLKPVSEERYQLGLRLIDVGTLLLRDKKFEEADATFAMAAELAPLAAAVDGRGCSALMRGEFDEAESFFLEAYAMDRTYDDALSNLGLLYDLRGEPERARELYGKFLESHPEAASTRNNLAAVSYDLGFSRNEVDIELRKAATLSGNGVILDNISKIGG